MNNKNEGSKGMNLTIVTSADDDEQALYVLRALGMPFVREDEEEQVEAS